MRSLDKRKIRRYVSIAIACLLIGGCASMDTKKELPVVASLDPRPLAAVG